MGARFSTLGNSPPGYPNKERSGPVFSIRIPSCDCIRIIGADEGTIAVIKSAVERGSGIKKEDTEEGIVSITFESKSSFFSNKLGAVAAAYNISLILEDLLKAGWEVYTRADLDYGAKSSALFFERTQLPNHTESKVLCLGSHNLDRFHLVNVPQELLTVVTETIREHWPYGISRERAFDGEGTFNVREIKVNRSPFTGGKDVGVNARKLILNLARVMAQHKWILYTCPTVEPNSADSMFFRYDPNFSCSKELAQKAFVLTLHKNDCLRLIEAPRDVEDALEKSIKEAWPLGIQKKSDYHTATEFKLKGYPWDNQEEDMPRNRLIFVSFFQTARAMGYHVLESMSIASTSLSEKSFFIFVPVLPASVPHFCLGLYKNHYIRLINASGDVVTRIRELVAKNYPLGIVNEKLFGGYHEIKLAGDPWSGGSDAINGFKLLNLLLAELSGMGWRALCSGDTSTEHHSSKNSHYTLSIHSLWFCRSG